MYRLDKSGNWTVTHGFMIGYGTSWFYDWLWDIKQQKITTTLTSTTTTKMSTTITPLPTIASPTTIETSNNNSDNNNNNNSQNNKNIISNYNLNKSYAH